MQQRGIPPHDLLHLPTFPFLSTITLNQVPHFQGANILRLCEGSEGPKDRVVQAELVSHLHHLLPASGAGRELVQAEEVVLHGTR